MRRRYTELSEEEIENIKILLDMGEPTWKIAQVTRRSESSVRKIKDSMNPTKNKNPSLNKRVNDDLSRWLYKNWRWKPPAEQKAKVPRRKKWKSNFITPYHFPGRPHF